MTSREAKSLGIPATALNPPIPKGWMKVKRGDVQEGDKLVSTLDGKRYPILEDDIGVNSKFYPCVIRRANRLKKRK